MSTTPEAPSRAAQSPVKVIAASLLGSTIEWYDFFIYGTAAALVFNKLFFTSVDPTAGTLAAFGTYAVGFIARPLGGVIFGHFGDRIGRKSMLVVTMVLMGLGTALIGVLPTYSQIGVWAPILLVVLRVAQGLGVGGEWGGAVLLAVENAPAHRRGFFGSFPQMGVPAGLMLSSLVLSVFSTLPEDQLLSWGWRVPFLISAALIALGLFVRLKIVEAPEFQQVKDSGREASMPALEVIRTQPKNLLLAMGMRIGENASIYLYGTFLVTYVSQYLHIKGSEYLNAFSVANLIGIATIAGFGALTDKIGRRPVYMFGAAFTAAFAFPFFALLSTGSTEGVWLAVIVAVAIGYEAMYAPQAAFFSEMFDARLRYSGASIGYQFASVIAGGLSPFIATALVAASGGSYVPVAIYLVVVTVITLVCTIIAKETRKKEFTDTPIASQRLSVPDPH